MTTACPFKCETFADAAIDPRDTFFVLVEGGGLGRHGQRLRVHGLGAARNVAKRRATKGRCASVYTIFSGSRIGDFLGVLVDSYVGPDEDPCPN